MNTFLTLPPASIRAWRGDRRGSFAAAAFFTVLALTGTAGAATLTVTTLNDNGPGSLRDTIANASAGDTIQIQATGTITLTSGELLISQNLTIAGPGASQLAISGNKASGVFVIAQGATVTLSAMTIENGLPANAFGGGIYNSGTLTVTNCTISGNTAQGNYGGGIGSYGPLTVIASTISGNSAAVGGGIVATDSLTITDSTIAGNLGSAAAAAVYSDGSLTVSGSTFSNNTTTAVRVSSGEGAALYQDDGSNGTITNSTFSGNNGAAIYSRSVVFPTVIQNSTIAGNAAGGSFDLFGKLAFSGTVLANNVGGNCFIGTASTSQGYNVSDDNTCAFGAATDKTSVAPGAGLDPKGLQNNGGPTQTIALLPASPAVNLIPAANCTLLTDQRKTSRPQGPGCDAGAYELVETAPFANFSAHLAIGTGKPAGFVLTSTFTLGSNSTGLQPASEAMTLAVGSYTLTLPAGSLHPLWNGANSPYIYAATVNGVKLALSVTPLGGNKFQFDAAGSPVTFSGVQNPVTISLTFGQDSGTTSVNALITPY